MQKFGSLKAVLEADPSKLKEIKGIGDKNVFELEITQAVSRRFLSDRVINKDFIHSSDEVMDYLKHNLRDKNWEIFLVIFLNGRNQIIKMEELFQGSLSTSMVYPREVIKQALDNDAAALVFVHNHPSGNSNPSQDDLNITKKLKEAAKSIKYPFTIISLLSGMTCILLLIMGYFENQSIRIYFIGISCRGKWTIINSYSLILDGILTQ